MAKGRKTGGRKKNTPNKATLERQINAAQVIDRARKEGRDLAVTVLERLMNVAEGACGLNRPTTKGELAAGKNQNPDGDWDRFGEWFDRTAYCAKALADFQSPKFRAIMVSAPLPEHAAMDITPAGDNVLKINDPVAAARVYAQMVKRVA